MGDHDAPFQHHLLDLAEAEREPVVEPDTVADDLRWEAKPLVGRRTDGHQTSSSQTQALDHPSHADREVDGAIWSALAKATISEMLSRTHSPRSISDRRALCTVRVFAE
jgi:hypothetical protein